MGTYKGSAGIDRLMRDLRSRSEMLVTNTSIGIMQSLISHSPISLEDGIYGGYYYDNDRGSFINNWEATVGVDIPPIIDRGGDPEANDALSSVQFMGFSYELGDNVVIANTSPYMLQVELEGWTQGNTEDRPFTTDALPYQPVRLTKESITTIGQKALKATIAGAGEVPF